MRQCGESLVGQNVCYVATLNPRSFNPFKGYYLCAQCRNSADVYRQFFPHEVLLHEPPDMVDAKRPNDLICVYQTNATQVVVVKQDAASSCMTCAG